MKPILAPARALLTSYQRLPKRGDPKRFWMHLIPGFLNSLLFLSNEPLAICLVVGFHSYQWIEEWRLNDHSYQDINGYNVGMFTGAIVVALVWFTGYIIPL